MMTVNKAKGNGKSSSFCTTRSTKEIRGHRLNFLCLFWFCGVKQGSARALNNTQIVTQ